MAASIDELSEKYIEAIIFDIGNVLFKVNLELLPESFSKVGIQVDQDCLHDRKAHELVVHYGVNKLKTLEFIQQISKLMNVEEEYSEIYIERFKIAWNAVITGLLKEMLEGVGTFRKQGYKIFALSDTNEMHAHYLQVLYQREFPGQDVFALFDKAYLSHKTGYHKSKDPQAWLQILSEQNLKPERCLFIDDILANIEKAQTLQINVLHFTPEKGLEDVVKTLAELNMQKPFKPRV